MDDRQPYRYGDSQEFYNDYYDEQVGNGYGVYGGRSVMSAANDMTGAGFGSVLAKLARKTLPFAKVLGKRLLSGTAGLAEDLLSGEDFATSASRRLASAGRGVAEDLASRKRSAVRARAKGRKSRKKDVFG